MLARGMSVLLLSFLALTPTGHGDGAEVSAQPWGYLLTGKHLPHSRPASAKTKSSGVTCTYTLWHVDGQENGGLEFVDPASNPDGKPKGKGAYYLVECTDGYRDVVWIPRRSGLGITPEELARRAYKMLPIRSPKVLTAPPRGQYGLVGLAHWFYLAKGEWMVKSKRIQVGAVWAEATAAPRAMIIHPGDGSAVTCEGPGTTYDPAQPADQQQSSCSYRYLHPKDAYRVSVTVIWNGTWRGSGGTGGTLPPITRTVTFPVRVAEAQALVTKG